MYPHTCVCANTRIQTRTHIGLYARMLFHLYRLIVKYASRGYQNDKLRVINGIFLARETSQKQERLFSISFTGSMVSNAIFTNYTFLVNTFDTSRFNPLVSR